MFEKKCSLCGGKIVNGRCVDCGLDASKNDKNYKMNQSSCDDQPMTHVHTSSEKATLYRMPKNPQYKTQATTQNHEGKNLYKTQATTQNNLGKSPYKTKDTKKKKKGKVGLIIFVIIILIRFLSANGGEWIKSAQEIFKNISDGKFTLNQTSNTGAYEEDFDYENVTRELRDEGEEYENTFSNGFYKVGEQIPEGKYTVTTMRGQGTMMIINEENDIFIYQSMGNGEMDDHPKEVEDVRLYQGAWIGIKNGVELQFVSKNAQVDELKAVVPNTITDSVQLGEDGNNFSTTAGVDFPAGTYDITVTEGAMYLKLFVPGHIWTDEETDEENPTEMLYMDAEEEINTYKNVALPEGTRLEGENSKAELTPSAEVVSDSLNMWETLDY